MNKIIFLILLLIMLDNITFVKADCVTNGLVLWLKFDEGSGLTAYDSIGNNYGSLINTPSWVKGIYGYALQFNGINQYVNVTTNKLPFGQTSISGTAWIKTASTSSMVAWTYGGSTTASRVGLWINNGKACFTGAYNNYCTGVNIADNNWHFIAFTLVGGSTTVSVYIDGIQYNGTLSSAITIPMSGNKFYIGADNIGLTDFFNGIIDDVRIYNRALSQSEILQIYNCSTSTTSTSSIVYVSLAADFSLFLLIVWIVLVIVFFWQRNFWYRVPIGVGVLVLTLTLQNAGYTPEIRYILLLILLPIIVYGILKSRRAMI